MSRSGNPGDSARCNVRLTVNIAKHHRIIVYLENCQQQSGQNEKGIKKTQLQNKMDVNLLIVMVICTVPRIRGWYLVWLLYLSGLCTVGVSLLV